ncbi:MAG: energy-coupled thiamine transporter ThiT [Oscillospiraceae bacterium]
MSTKKALRCICEGAVFVAMAMVLSYIKIPIGVSFGGFGGSIDLVMVPLVLYAVRWGAGWGLGAGLIFGTLKYFFAAGFAVNWQSMALDYSVAYMAVGLAGLFMNRKWGLVSGGLAGCLARFAVHFISGITIYAQYMPEEFMNLTMTSTWLYSLLYNSTYMLPNTVIVIAAGAALSYPLRKYIRREDLAA